MQLPENTQMGASQRMLAIAEKAGDPRWVNWLSRFRLRARNNVRPVNIGRTGEFAG